VTITTVTVTKKMESAKVEVSVIPSTKGDAALATLRGATGYLQYLLMKKMNIKPMPQIAFVLDRGPENAAAVEKVLIKEKKQIDKGA
jgi:ribosome-binding factor A